MSISIESFDLTKDKEEVKLFTLKNNYMEIEILNYGGIIKKISIPDKHGKYENIVLAFDKLSDYEERSPYFGAIVGRTAGRIRNANLEIDGTSYSLPVNNGPNTLHGGPKSFSHRVWAYKTFKNPNETILELQLKSPHLDNGYPGNILATVTYTLKNKELIIDYKITTDRKTFVCPTNHSYFNLSGDCKIDVSKHLLKLNIDEFLEVDENTLPTKISNVKNSAFDFSNFKELKELLISDEEQVRIVNQGIDHPFIVKSNVNETLATLLDKESGRKLEVRTDAPGLVIYTGNYLNEVGKIYNNIDLKKYDAICFETQELPDILNLSKTNDSLKLRLCEVEKPYISRTIFKFDTELS